VVIESGILLLAVSVPVVVSVLTASTVELISVESVLIRGAVGTESELLCVVSVLGAVLVTDSSDDVSEMTDSELDVVVSVECTIVAEETNALFVMSDVISASVVSNVLVFEVVVVVVVVEISNKNPLAQNTPSLSGGDP
jgi:hypothetical protein